MSGGTSCLSIATTIIGVIFAAASVAGIGFSLFLVFSDPFESSYIQGTYEPNWEDIGPALVVSVVSLLANVLLIGGSRQLSKDFLLVWIVWKSIAIFTFWVWYGYNQLKYYGYIDWSQYGMKNCMFCDFNPEATYTVFGGVAATVLLLFCMVPVEILRSKLKRRHRELTEPLGLYNSEHNLSPYNQQQMSYEMYQQQQNEMIRRQLQNYQQYPPPPHHDHQNGYQPQQQHHQNGYQSQHMNSYQYYPNVQYQ